MPVTVELAKLGSNIVDRKEKQAESVLSGDESTIPCKPPRLIDRHLGSLFAGSRFDGQQTSGRSTYAVTVDIQHVDLRNSFLCGYLSIKGLTDDYPDLSTFFEAEIIGSEHSFLTRKWDADEAIDRQHWARFAEFAPYEKYFDRDGFTYDFEESDVIFMRWKEHFLVPDHRIKAISGASFAGFYYIAYSKRSGEIQGIYFHQNSEWFQQLILKHVPSTSFPAFEFR
ncbi:GID complex subunit 4, VID24 [Thoreauomyces humboldtii]|nr:GID complex subunit 4, VID24 [Thoreauomyces humboldtii]